MRRTGNAPVALPDRAPRISGLALVLPALALVIVLYGIPLSRLAVMSFGEQDSSLAAYRSLFGDWSYADILLRTFRVSGLIVCGCLLFGYPLGYVLAFASPRRRALLSLLVLLPLWTSVLVRNFAWVYLLRRGSVLSELVTMLAGADEPVQLLYNESGVVIGMVGTLLPFMVFPVLIALASQPRNLIEAAASLGAGPARTFFTVTLPLSRGGIFAGSLLVFATAIGFFITPALLGGGRVPVAATFIDQQLQDFVDWPIAAAAAMVLLAAVLIIILLYRRGLGARARETDHAVI